MTESQAPPPVLCFARVLSYAIVDSDVQFTGRRTLYSDGKEVGAVPRLALCQNVGEEGSEIMLFHCDEEWNVLGVGGEGDTLSAAKADAEVSYRGIASKWTDTGLSEDEARRWLEERYPSSLCSFCGRLPFQFKSMARGHNAGICDDCVRKYFVLLGPGSSGDEDR